jgi:hypothetical protein
MIPANDALKREALYLLRLAREYQANVRAGGYQESVSRTISNLPRLLCAVAEGVPCGSTLHFPAEEEDLPKELRTLEGFCLWIYSQTFGCDALTDTGR